ncbi:MAG: sensor histidine kinase [Almyronema sp.]
MPISQPIRYQNHPFPFLLYLEWALLAMAIASELMPPVFPRLPHFPALVTVSTLLFALLGLYLPTGKIRYRLGHVAAQIGLILLASGLGTAGLRLFPFLCLVLVIRSCFMFVWPGRLMVAGAAFVLFLSTVQLRLQWLGERLSPFVQARVNRLLIPFQLNFVFLFSLSLAFVMLLVNALLAERQSQTQLKQANQQLRQSATKIEQLAMSQERSRIARDIHDSLGHSLTALNIQLESALKLWQANPEKAFTFLREAKRLGSTALQDVRQSVSALRDEPLQDQPLEPAIAALIQQFQGTTGIQPRCQIALVELPDKFKTTLYRIVQEALTNIYKHAQASEVDLVLQSGRQVYLKIQDNGCGFDPVQTSSGFGLRGIQERVESLGGRCQISSQPGQGCCLQVWLPQAGENG